MKNAPRRSEMARLNDLAEQALREAVENVVRTHRRLGLPLVVWRDGKVVEVPPQTLAVRESPGHYSVRKKTP